MEYFELQTAPANAMFDKIMSNDPMRLSFSPSGPAVAGYRPLPIPVFNPNHAKSVAALERAVLERSLTHQPGSAELSRRPFMPMGHIPPHNLGGVLQQQTPGESASSLQGDAPMEKTKRNGREGGGRGSRGGGTSGRKRTRGGQMAESLTTGSVLEGSVSGGGVQSTGRATAAGNGVRQTNNTGDKPEKSTGRRQSGQGTKRGEKKQPLPVVHPVSEALCSLYSGHPHTARAFEPNVFPAGWSNGVLDIYGMRTRPTNIAQYMADIPLNDLLSDSFVAPRLVLKDSQDLKSDMEESLDQNINTILQLLPKRPAMWEAPREAADSVGPKLFRHPKLLLDLESPIPPEDDEGLSRQEKSEEGLGSTAYIGNKFEDGSEKDARVVSHGTAGPNVPTQRVSSFSIDGLPLLPFEDFMTRLKLGPSDPLQSLIVQAQADGDTNVTSDTRMDSAVVEICHRNGSVPPLPCSYPPVGPVKAEHCKRNHRIWQLQTVPASSSAKGDAVSSGRDTLVGTEDEAVAKSPNSRWRKLDDKVYEQSTEAMELCTPHPAPSKIVDPLPAPQVQEVAVSVKDEPRQVENAVVLSSEGVSNPMEVDSCRVDSGAISITVTDRPESLPGKQVNTVECEQERSGGEAVRPLETPATLAGPQEMDTHDRESKPLADVKQEAGDQELKELVESNGESKPDLTVFKENVSLDGPTTELKITCASPPRNESSFTLSAVPMSPGVSVAAEILISLHAAQYPPVEQEKNDGENERKRRVHQPYQGAPAAKAAKSMRVGSTNYRSGDGGKEGRTNTDGGSVLPSKALVSERRKSLSQIDTPEKPSMSSPRNSSGAGVSTSSRGASLTAARTSNLSVKVEKSLAKESAKDSSSNKEGGGRSLSSLPPLSVTFPPLKTAHKGAKTNGYAHSGNSKGSVATANLVKGPAACSSQRVVSGGSRGSRPAHINNTPASHGTAPIPVKSSRQSIPDGRQKKTDGSARGAKSSRD